MNINLIRENKRKLVLVRELEALDGEPWERSDHGGGSPVHQAIQPWGTKFLGHKDPHGWIIRLGVTG